jgi:hypothetical protein
MINISEAEKDLYRSDGVNKEVVITVPGMSITIDNEDLIKESVTLTERIESEKELSFKGCCASIFSFEVAHFSQDIRGQYIEATIRADGGVTLPLFSGYVDSQNNTNHEDYVSKITAIDALKPVLDRDVTAWYNALSFPITIKNMRDSFFTLVGMSQETVFLVNDGLQVTKSVDDPIITGATILKSICQLNGRFGIYGRDKKFHYRRLGSVDAGLFPSDMTFPSTETFPAEPNANEQILKNSYMSVDYQPYDTMKVSKVVIIGQDGSIKGQNGNDTKDSFYIADNKLAWGLVNANLAATNILSEIVDVGFTPTKLQCKGLPYLECGDIILANTRINAISSYILERTLSGIQALTDSLVGDISEIRKPYQMTTQTAIAVNEVSASTAQSTAESAQSSASAAQSSANTAQGTANTARGEAQNAQGTANNAIQRVGAIEADYVKTASISAVNGRIDNLSSTVATINRLYVNSAQCNTIASNAITTKLATLQALAVSGRITASSFAIGATTFTTKQANVRLANGGTLLMTYLGF